MREISLKAVCEKVKLSNSDFYNAFRDNEWTYTCKLFKNIFNDIQTKVKRVDKYCLALLLRFFAYILYQSKD